MPMKDSKRRALLLAALKAGRTPVIKRYLPGAEDILIQFGYKPGVDVYVPSLGEDPEVAKLERSRIQYRNSYHRRKL